MNRTESIRDILEELIAHFTRQKDISHGIDRIANGAAVNYLSLRNRMPLFVTREQLLIDHKYWTGKAKSFVHKDEALQEANRAMAAKTVESIIMLGKRISVLDNAQ